MGLKEWIEKPAAHVVSSERSLSNVVRGAVARVTTPLLPDDYLHLVNPLWSARELRGRIVEVRSETPDSATIVIRPGWGFDFEYEPGQYVGIGLHIEGRWHWRSYSLTSTPVRDDKLISIAVKAMPEGFLSSHLVSGVPAGTVVRLAAPQGDFVLPDPPPEKILFLTAGSGITPIMSMLRTLDRRATERGAAISDVVHIHSAPTPDSVMFRSELEGSTTPTIDSARTSSSRARRVSSRSRVSTRCARTGATAPSGLAVHRRCSTISLRSGRVWVSTRSSISNDLQSPVPIHRDPAVR